MANLCNVGILKRSMRVIILLVITAVVTNLPSIAKKGRKLPKPDSGQVTAILWSRPGDILHRNLSFGQGGQRNQPHGIFTFVKEDLDGSSPKFNVRDQEGTKWKVKLGPEARPETAATRLVWAVGYRVDEDYFVPLLHVSGLPPHLHRGQEWIGPGGEVHNARLERYLKGEKKAGHWDWKLNPFSGTRELNGLRIMMALVNNWDLKNDNNAIYDDSQSGSSKDGRHLVYLVNDLGASFGAGGRSWTMAKSKDNLTAYRRSKFIRKVGHAYVDFNDPKKPPFLFFFNLPEFILQMQMHWVCRHIPQADARWIGQLLAQLSPQQIRDAFRAAGYSPDEINGYAAVVEGRIAELNDL
jgi:hypothetical protein